jgi:hypothetical protein
VRPALAARTAAFRGYEKTARITSENVAYSIAYFWEGLKLLSALLEVISVAFGVLVTSMQ